MTVEIDRGYVDSRPETPWYSQVVIAEADFYARPPDPWQLHLWLAQTSGDRVVRGEDGGDLGLLVESAVMPFPATAAQKARFALPEIGEGAVAKAKRQRGNVTLGILWRTAEIRDQAARSGTFTIDDDGQLIVGGLRKSIAARATKTRLAVAR